MNKKTLKNLIATIGLVAITAPAYAEYNFILPDPEDNAILYYDFYSYSGPILAEVDSLDGVSDGNGSVRCGYGSGSCESFAYDDTLAGKVDEELNVLAYQSGGAQEVTNQPSGAEDAYVDDPGAEDWQMSYGSNPDNGSTQLADNPDLWDVNLQTFVDELSIEEGGSAVLVFNNNEQDDQASQTLVAWFQVIIWDSQNGSYQTIDDSVADVDGLGTKDPIVFTFQNYCPDGNVCISGGDYFVGGDGSGLTGGIIAGLDKDPTLNTELDMADNTYPNPDVPPGSVPTAEDFVISGGKVCEDASFTIVDCDDPSVAYEFEHNLGADRISYMLYSPELNDLLLQFVNGDLEGYDMLSMDMRLGCYDPVLVGETNQGPIYENACGEDEVVDNGSERAFWASAYTPGTVLPEPGTLALLGIGLLGAGLARRKKVC